MNLVSVIQLLCFGFLVWGGALSVLSPARGPETLGDRDTAAA
ncbi:MAG TPA: hypothetical protein VFI80_00620 [Burkholderiales bacterium]|nr:hypothetical protein [Burkholderiales bacterium]